MTTITVFKGDGIGPEITDAVIKVLNAAGADLEYEFFNVGAKVYEETKEYIPEKAFESYEKNKILLKSPITTPVGKGFRSLNVTLRNKYDLWANIRPAKSNPCIPTRFENVDIVTFRENTEDLYVGKEEQIDENTVYAYKIITKKASTRIIKAAFEYCVKHNRKKLTCVHKANILKMSDGLFLHIFEDIAKDYPQIEANSLIVDNTCMQLVMPDIAGKHIANPSALLLSACMMLDDLHQDVVSSKIRKALNKVFEEHSVLTPDLGGNATTEQFPDEIIKNL